MRSRCVTWVWLLLTVGCGRSLPTEPMPTSTLTPVAVANVAGSWAGTFRPASAMVCGGNDKPASATFVQNGAMVTGEVHGTLCAGISGSFHGEFAGLTPMGLSSLTGNIGSLTVGAAASDSHIEMRIGYPDSGLRARGWLTLDR